MRKFLEKVINQENLRIEEMKEAAKSCFNEQISDSELAAFLIALRAKGETPEEIAGLAEIIRSESSQKSNRLTNVMDNCGTGGDGSYSFNISTTAAFVIAGAGVTVAKHGNRSISSKTGSADVLEHLGISLTFQKEQMEEILHENNIAFLYAPNIHQGMKRFMKVRQDLRIPTVFNLIGPLTNPVTLDTQFVGVYRRDMLPMIAETMHRLGRRRAIAINGAGYMDEASLAGENHLSLLNEGKVTNFTIHPSELDLPVYPNEKIRGGNAEENADILLRVLNGKPGPYYDTVLLNAGLGLYANGIAQTMKSGIDMARESIASGAALEKLHRLADYSKKILVG
ncbi:anthranilate phosphoribosyltransferase [Virgibacillus alimentarius]|uniref:Anthranilate phosphoribosyltransferase n=1 Tax=Virgibacillus alimentarius TaxID=698769 RepID=A0ABS4S823_9BACI|nr:MULTISPECIES: anthranilate phosphoribosyltransferase [Virgibacillus]MBP2257221.1 anthranilate phosphoribosyltransferase/anthranilate synthase/phosphoribosyltransferase [Virgibacillus alimentarius]HLR67395.1 anthranilate phosphoribosyltransferase [Virgibacillus sp.]